MFIVLLLTSSLSRHAHDQVQQHSCFCDIASLLLGIPSLIVFKMHNFKIKRAFLCSILYNLKKIRGKKQQKNRDTKQKPDQKRNQRSLSCISYNSKEVGQWFLLFNIKGLIISPWHFLSAEGECLCLCV